MPKYSFNKLLGYTLIEVLVSLSIISILFGVGFVSYRDFSRRQYVDSFAQKIKADLALTREKAASGEKPTHERCSGTNTLSGYYFRLRDEDYKIQAVCSEGLVDTKVVTIPSDLSVTISSTNPILFKVLSSGTNLSSLNTITIKQTATGKETSVSITQYGEIK